MRFGGLFAAFLLCPLSAHAQLYTQSERSEPFVPLANIPGITNLSPLDFSSRDEGSADILLPFDFSYLGQSYSSLTLSVNGQLVFPSGTGSYINDPIGDPSAPNAMIAPWWDDLILPSETGHASHGILGAAPQRIFIIEVRDWEAWPLNNVTDGIYQVWLYEGPRARFEVRFEGALESGEGYSATTGWEGPGAAPFGAFRPCAQGAPYCGPADYATMRSVVFTVERAEGPELLGAVGSFGRGALPGATVLGPITLENVGTVDVPPVSAGLYLSLDPLLDSQDILLQSILSSPLLAGAGPLTFTATVTVPAISPGDYYVLLNIDEPNAVAEVEEGNNLAVSPQRFATAHDVALTSATAPAPGAQGTPITVDVQLANLGVPYVGAVGYELYASRDPLLSPQDVLLGAGAVSLSGAQTESMQLSGTLPQLAAGRYRVIARLDPAGVITELNEQNNVVPSVLSFPFGPDLVPTAVVPQGGAAPGAPLSLSVALDNLGVPYAGSVQLRLVASPDPIYDAADPLMGSAAVSLSGQATESVQATVTVPQLGPGTYHAIVIVDPQDAIDEIDDFNNVHPSATRFSVGPDLSVGAITAPAQADAGQPISITTRITSTGAPYSGPVSYRLYLSADQQLSPQDSLLGVYSINLMGELFVDDVQTPLFPQGLPPVGHYTIAVVDPGQLVTEADEQNNLLVDDVRIASGSDLRPLLVDFSPSIVRLGDSLAVNATLEVSGTPYQGSVDYRLWLTDSFFFDPADSVPLSDGTVSLSGASAPLSVSLPITAQVPPGSWYVALQLDARDQIAEPDEDNNAEVSGALLTVEGANLRVLDFSAPPLAFSGQSMPVQLTIDNNDVAPAQGFRIAYILTRGGALSPPVAQELFRSPLLNLAPGQRLSMNDMVMVPAQTATGAAQLLVQLDVEEAVPETDPQDNLVFLPGNIAIYRPSADLSIQIEGTSTIAAAGEELAILRTARNLGVADAPSVEFFYYLSDNPQISRDDLVIGAVSLSLSQGEEDRQIDLLSVPVDVPPGRYYLGALMDPRELIAEPDEQNNAALGPLLQVYEAPLRIVTDALPQARLQGPYEAALIAVGGIFARQWRVVEGALPAGLSLDPGAGIIRGTPEDEGFFEFRVQVQSGPTIAERGLSLRVAPPTVPLQVATLVLPRGLLDRPYEAPLIGVGGLRPYSWSALAPLPPGLSMSPEGRLFGAPEVTGQQRLVVQVRDATGELAQAQLALNVSSPQQAVLITQSPLPEGTLGAEYCPPDQIRLFASGGLPPYRWSLMAQAPPGMRLSEDGALCGAPEEVGAFSVLARVEDQAGAFDTSLFILKVHALDELTSLTRSLPDAPLGAPYEARLSATLGQPPYRWSLADGALPEGLSLDEAGVVQGSPSALGSFAFVVQLSDSAQGARLVPLSVRVVEERPTKSGGCRCARPPQRAPVSLLLVLSGLLGLCWRLRP